MSSDTLQPNSAPACAMAVTSHDGSPPASVEREAEPEAAPEGTGDRLLLRAREALSEDMGMAVLQVGAKEEDPLEPKRLR